MPGESRKSTQLLDAIKSSYWETVRSILRQPSFSSSKADYMDETKMTALHYACLDPSTPEDVMDKLLSLSVKAFLVQDMRGDTPLHTISDTSDVMSLRMIEACPRASFKVNKFGETALHRAVFRNRSTQVIEALLYANPAAVMCVNKRGRKPLHEIFEMWDPGLKIMLLELAQEEDYMTSESILEMHVNTYFCRKRRLGDIYEQTLLLLKAYGLGSLDNDRQKFLPLHYLLKVGKCPFSFFELFVKMSLDDEVKADEEGNLPLHLAAKGQGKESYEIFCYLLQDDYGAASVKNNKGETPFGLALLNGKHLEEDSLEAIIQTSPNLLGEIDNKTELLPFMMAAVGQKMLDAQKSMSQLNAVYFLLRQQPEFISWGISSKNDI